MSSRRTKKRFRSFDEDSDAPRTSFGQQMAAERMRFSSMMRLAFAPWLIGPGVLLMAFSSWFLVTGFTGNPESRDGNLLGGFMSLTIGIILSAVGIYQQMSGARMRKQIRSPEDD